MPLVLSKTAGRGRTLLLQLEDQRQDLQGGYWY
jgi:hypothetical protein